MKVMIHGAINLSNYGDYIFASLFDSALKKKGFEVEYYSHPKYGISDYFAKKLGYSPDYKHYKDVMDSCDALIYISGGYFLSHDSISVEFRHTRRFLTPGMFFMKSGKPIYILGVGAGPFSKGPFSNKAKQLLQYASVVTVRDEESKEHCLSLGVDRDIHVTADTALAIRDYISNKSENPCFSIGPDKKILLFHITSNRSIKRKMKLLAVPAIKKFLETHKDYELYISSDGIMPEIIYHEYASMFKPYIPHILKYDDPWVLTKLIERADLILTTKLHMGIIGAVFGKSVVSFPWHPKTQRFYKQIGEEDRCIMLSGADEEIVFQQLERFEGKPIALSNGLIEKAKLNLEMLPKPE